MTETFAVIAGRRIEIFEETLMKIAVTGKIALSGNFRNG